MVNKISEAIDSNKFSIGVFIDLPKAFDTIDHRILLNKLEHYGIRGLALSWFKSYLDNRSQFVTFNGVSSTNLNITCGVPQGSILGPILFLLYINDITSASNLLNFVLFADDTNTFIDHHNLNTLIDLLNTELKLLDTWFIANKLSLNINKTNFIVFTGLRKKYDVNCIANKITFNGQIIKQTHSTKFLGVYIDQHLNWLDHIHQVENKISKTCGILSKLKYKLPKSILLTIYNSLILPYLQYCTLIWACGSQNKLKKLLIIQKRAVRHISHVHSTCHSAPIFKELNILTINDIYTQQVAQFMFKYTAGLLPIAFSGYFNINSQTHHHYTRQSEHFHISFANTRLRQHSISISGPRIWNALDSDLQLMNSFSVFTSKLKESFFMNYL